MNMLDSLGVTVEAGSADARAFSGVLEDILDVLDAIAAEQGRDADWRIVSLHKHSPPKFVLGSRSEIFASLVAGMKKLEDGGSNPFNSHTTKAVKRLGRCMEMNRAKVVFERAGQPEFRPTPRLFRNAARSLSRGFYAVHGSIDGTLDIVNVHAGAKFSIFDELDHREIHCKFPEGFLEEVRRNIGRRVSAIGIVKYRSSDDLPVSIEVEAVESLDDSSPMLFSDMPPIDLAGPISSEQYVRQLRDGQ